MQLNLWTAALLLGSSVSSVLAAPHVPIMRGFNLGTHDRNGQCKSKEQLRTEFLKIKNDFSANAGFSFTVIKLFTTSDCDLLAKAAPIAKEVGVTLWTTVWNHPEDKFNREKGALEAAIRAHGTSWLQGIGVGSESLYRNETKPWRLAEMIYDVKGMVQKALNAPHVPVGTSDTWTMYDNGANADVMKAIDVALMNGFPYWQGSSPEMGLIKLDEAIARTRAKIHGKRLIVSETGWPTRGDAFQGSVPSVENLQRYWKDAACTLKNRGTSFFWFSAFDEPAKQGEVERSFGVADANMNLKINLRC